MQRQDWLLLVLSHAGSAGLTPVQLQKSLFLLGRNKEQQVGANFYSFVPYNYGPFSFDIYADAETLRDRGLIEIQYYGNRFPDYKISDAGNQSAEVLKSRVEPNLNDYANRVTKWTQQLSFPQLVRAIYEKYPEFRKNSVFRG
jgi:uncharacterized protein YwgA